MLKLMKNCFLSAKVSIMNEFHDFCSAAKVDYNAVIELAKKDARMGTSHFQVPGPDGRRGFGGTCFPKDTHSLYCQMNAHGMTPHVFPAVLARNDTHDRPEREWSKDVWRTTIPLPSATSKVVVVFSDSDTSDTSSSYLTDIIRDNLSKQNVVIQIVREASVDAIDVSLSRHHRHPNHFIKHRPNAGMPLFFPRVDECYYTQPSIQNHTMTSYDTLREVSCIIDLWNSHEEMVLNVIKSSTDRPTETDNESGTEGFDDDNDDNDDYISDYQRRPYYFDYAKIIEEYYYSTLSQTHRKLIIMF